MDPQDEKEKPAAQPLPVVPRIDRLEVLIQILEEKQRLSEKQGLNTAKSDENSGVGDDVYKSVSTALKEVHSKGTLMDRITLLENRVLQLSLQLDVGSTSKSTSSLSAQNPERNVAEGSDHIDGRKEIFRLQGKLNEPPESIQSLPQSRCKDVGTEDGGERRHQRTVERDYLNGYKFDAIDDSDC